MILKLESVTTAEPEPEKSNVKNLGAATDIVIVSAALVPAEVVT